MSKKKAAVSRLIYEGMSNPSPNYKALYYQVI